MTASPPRPLRVALATSTDAMGGAEVMMVHLAEGLRDRGHDVTVLLPDHGPGWLSAELGARAIAVRRLPLGRVRWAPVRALRAALAELRADVLHSHMIALAMFGAAATAGADAAHVITMHGTGHETSAARRRWALRAAIRTSAAAVAVSEGLRVELRGLIGAAAGRMLVLPNGVPERRGERGRTRAALGVRDGELLVLAVGNLYRNKAHAVLLDALAQLPPGVPWRVAIAGRPEDALPDLEARIAERQWQDRVRLLGPRADVPDLLAAADVYAMPSLNEALPMALLEAMVAGKTIVASAVGGIPEAARDGREALLVPPGDVGALGAALGRLLSDPELRLQLGAHARERARDAYGVARMIEAHESLYYDVVRRRRRPDRPGT